MAAGLPTSVITEIEFTAGVWTDVSTFVKGDSMEISVGADSAASGVQPGTLDLDLDNADGRFTPDNATSTYYPNFVEGRRVRVRVTKGTTSVRFVGRIVALQPDFPIEPTQSVTHLSAVDLLGDLERVRFAGSLLKSYVLATPSTFFKPDIGFYPLDEVTGERGGIDITGKLPALQVFSAAATGAADWSSAGGLDADGTQFVTLPAGKSLRHTGSAMTWTYSGSLNYFGFYVYLNEGSYGEIFTLSQGPRASSVSNFRVDYAATGFTYYVDNVPAPTTTTTITPGWNAIGLRGQSGQITLSLNGTELVSASVAGTSYDCLSIGGGCDIAAAYVALGSGAWNAYLTQIARGGTGFLNMNTALDLIDEAADIASLGGSSQFSGAASDTRAATSIKATGRSALDAYVDIANDCGGYAYHAYSSTDPQKLTILTRADSRPTAPTITVDAEGDLVGGPSLVRALNDTVTAATVTTQQATYTITDGTNASLVGGATADRLSILVSDDEVRAIATDILARGVGNKTRLTSVTVNFANASNDLYASLFALTPGKRLRLSGLPSTYFGVTYIDGYVAGWTERPSVNGYEVTFNLDPADAPPEAILDDATYSRIPWGDGVCTLTTGITSAATSMSLTFTGTALLSTSAGDYPLDLDLNGERVTITSAPAGGSSPRTVTVTRGVAPTVARAHSAGEPIDVWNAARIAL